MNFKKIVSAVAFGLAASSASAVPLDKLTGNLEVKLVGLTTETNTWAGTNESTWGVGYLTTIENQKGDTWNNGEGYYLYYMIYGIADYSTNSSSDPLLPFNIFNAGAQGGVADGKIHLDLYRSATKIDALHSKTASPLGRTGYNSYAAFAGLGPAYLTITFETGIQQVDVAGTGYDERQATLVQTVDGLQLPANGKGSFYADVTGGTAKSQWDTNGQAGGRDMLGLFTLKPNANQAFAGGTCSATATTCFAGLINDPISTAKIPEPASLALFGLGLAGLAGLRRRRAAK